MASSVLCTVRRGAALVRLRLLLLLVLVRLLLLLLLVVVVVVPLAVASFARIGSHGAQT